MNIKKVNRLQKLLVTLGISIQLIVQAPKISNSREQFRPRPQVVASTIVTEQENSEFTENGGFKKNSGIYVTVPKSKIKKIKRTGGVKHILGKCENAKTYEEHLASLQKKDVKSSLSQFQQEKLKILEDVFTREMINELLFPSEDFLNNRLQRRYKITINSFCKKRENFVSAENKSKIVGSRQKLLYNAIYASDINKISANQIIQLTGGFIGVGALGVGFTQFILKKIYERQKRIEKFIKRFFDESDPSDCAKMSTFLKEILKSGKGSSFFITLKGLFTTAEHIALETKFEKGRDRENPLQQQEVNNVNNLRENALLFYNVVKQHYPKMIAALVLLSLINPNVRSFIKIKANILNKRIFNNLNSLNKLVQQLNDKKFFEKEQDFYCSEDKLLLHFAANQIQALSKDLNELKDLSVTQNDFFRKCMNKNDALMILAQKFRTMYENLLIDVTIEYGTYTNEGGTLIPDAINSNNKKLLGLPYLLQEISKAGRKELEKRE